MNREEIEFIKHCGEHFEFLTGGRGHSKTKKIIEQLQQENKQLKEVVEEIWNFIKKYPGISQSGVMTIKQILDKAKED